MDFDMKKLSKIISSSVMRSGGKSIHYSLDVTDDFLFIY